MTQSPMREDSPVCRSEGHGPRSQVLLMAHGREVTATLYQITGGNLVQVGAGTRIRDHSGLLAVLES